MILLIQKIQKKLMKFTVSNDDKPRNFNYKTEIIKLKMEWTVRGCKENAFPIMSQIIVIFIVLETKMDKSEPTLFLPWRTNISYKLTLQTKQTSKSTKQQIHK